MSKKKTKSKYEKATVKHDFAHLEKTIVVGKVEASVNSTESEKQKEKLLSPQNVLVGKDLRSTGIILSAFIGFVVVLGLLTYYTHLFSPFFKIFGLSY